MTDLTALSGMAWADVELEGLAWIEAGRDLVVRVRSAALDRAQARGRVITCRWTEGLAVNLHFGNGRGGYPLTWAVTFDRLTDGRCSVVFDFADSGDIRFVCADIEVS